MKVAIDKKKCIGCGACAAICQKVFSMDKDGKAKAKTANTQEQCAKEEADACPTSAILIK